MTANSANARVLLREDLASQAGIHRNIVENPSSVWGSSLDDLKYSLTMDGATVENVAAKGSGNAQVFNVKVVRLLLSKSSTLHLQ